MAGWDVRNAKLGASRSQSKSWIGCLTITTQARVHGLLWHQCVKVRIFHLSFYFQWVFLFWEFLVLNEKSPVQPTWTLKPKLASSLKLLNVCSIVNKYRYMFTLTPEWSLHLFMPNWNPSFLEPTTCLVAFFYRSCAIFPGSLLPISQLPTLRKTLKTLSP